MYIWLSWVMLVTLQVRKGLCLEDFPLSQAIKLEKDLDSHTLYIKWRCAHPGLYDVEIYRTEFMESVFNETVEARWDKNNGLCQWTWTSQFPLECTSHSVRIRSRDPLHVGEWSPSSITEGKDIPNNSKIQVYPQDKVVLVGSSTSFCCIVGEGDDFVKMMYENRNERELRLSRRSYAITRTNQSASRPSGNNVVCSSREAMYGATIFVGYPPGDYDLTCDTRDLESAECQWKVGRDTRLYGRRKTRYTLNGRNVSSSRKQIQTIQVGKWESSWILVAENPLGNVELRDSAQLTDRVHPVAPGDLKAGNVNAWNVTLEWTWPFPTYKDLPLICQVQITANAHSDMRNFSRPGLSQVSLLDLQPYETYRVIVRCGSQNNFWKWGDWSPQISFQTKMDRPEVPDIWIWMKSANAGFVLWKPLSRSESHGVITGYEVTQERAPEDGQWTYVYPMSQRNATLILQDNSSQSVVYVRAKNSEFHSNYSRLAVPKYWPDTEDPVYEVAVRDGGFDLSWPASANGTLGYVVEWVNTACGLDCTVDWLKVPDGNTSAKIPSRDLIAGVRYTFSLFGLSDEGCELLQRWHGYSKEMVPAQSVLNLEANQYKSNVQLTWGKIPCTSQRGFVRGYNIYLVHISSLRFLTNITDPNVMSYTVKKLSLSSYKFTVKAYTDAGEDGGATVSVNLGPYSDFLIVEILVSLGSMSLFFALIAGVCYKKRNWVKKAFYPDIPEPKLPDEWTATQAPLEVKPSPHSMVQIMERQWDSGKGGLCTVPENDEDGSGTGNEPMDTDSDEPPLLQYYNQVVSNSSEVHPGSDSSSSTSSLASANTDVTYTGIQISGCCYNAATEESAECPGSYRPQMLSEGCQEEPQADLESPGLASFGGYRPQCSWKVDSAEALSFDSSVGSPTSVNSTQFLIPDVSTEDSRNTSTSKWFPSFLSGKTMK
ncbi:LIF receptor subunit alpha a [Denticeps clupeoides]|uniref:Fibronectin type-III domain-containing protein n=1 Tax=Denticeps clupeoides TaxID=299321 RepID=A0AAY4BXU2_9TELE|nr:leukemia inhibitory factor receptor-like [Denticeps clupeoides]